MNRDPWYLFAADAILFLHVLLVLFLVGGLVSIYLGALRNWSWVRNPWFRMFHLLAATVVALQSWLGRICPLTSWEAALRTRGGGAAPSGSFIVRILETIIYYEAPEWVFILAYTLFAALVAGGWFTVRPRPFGSSR